MASQLGGVVFPQDGGKDRSLASLEDSSSQPSGQEVAAHDSWQVFRLAPAEPWSALTRRENSMTRRGFTLIELLVVIAIIAILAAILFPVFMTAKERGRQAKCCSNLKQLSQAFFNYCDDHNGYLPIGSRRMMNWYSQDHNAVEWTGTLWLNSGEQVHPIDVKKGSLWPYVRNREVYNCPTDRDMPSWSNVSGWSRINGARGPADSGNTYRSDLPDMGGLGLSYAMNFYLAIKGTSPYMTTVKLGPATVGRASQVLFLIHETRGQKGVCPGINDGYFSWPGDYYDKIHWDGTTCSYADGHVKWLPNKEMARCENANPSPWWRNSRYYGQTDWANRE